MQIHNPEIALFYSTSLADLLEIQGENSFRIHALPLRRPAYQRITSECSRYAKGRRKFNRINPVLERSSIRKNKIIVKIGKLPHLEQLEKKCLWHLAELLLIEGLGPKRIKMLHDNLDIKNSADLKKSISTC